MPKKWIVVIFMTILLIVGTWFLYAYQPQSSDGGRILVNPILQQVTSSLPEETVRSHREVTVFVGDPVTGSLVRKIREIEKSQDIIQEINQTAALLIQPDTNAYNEAIPRGTRLINVFITSAGIAYVNMNRHLQDRHVGGITAELATVAALVNTLLLNFQQIKQVQILVEGAEIETLAGHVDCRKPFSTLLLME